MARPVVILFARAPRLGGVKRRLAAGIGAVAALRFYRNQLGRIAREVAVLKNGEKVLARTPDRAAFAVPKGLQVIGQGQGDLGQRMAAAFRRYPGRLVVLVGADIPGLGGAEIRAALRALRHADAVFGPAEDGGFYLVAMGARRPAHPFAAVRWSSPQTLADTLQNFAGLRVRLIRTLRDVDTAADLPARRPSNAA
jgi:rSAM/selenodomain-associated transferase 1